MDKKKLLTIGGILAYIIICLFVCINLPNILSGGNEDVKTILTTGQSSVISYIDIDLNTYKGQLDASNIKLGKMLYLTRKNNATNGEIVAISDKNHGEYFKAVVESINNNVIHAKQYAVATKGGSGFKPGINAFQVIVFLALILIPIIILGKNGLLTSTVLANLSLPSIVSSSKHTQTKRKSKTKYGDQGTGYIAQVGDLRELSGSDGFEVSKNFRLSADKSYEHVLVLGPTGAGKSTSFYIPNLLDLDGKHSAVVMDPKGEMDRLCSPYLKSIGYKVIRLSPLNMQDGDFIYDPVLLCQDDQEMHEMAQLILTNGGKTVEMQSGASSGNAEWLNMSVPLLTASLIYVKEFGIRKSVTEALDIIANDSLEELQEKFQKNKQAFRNFLIFKASAGSEKTAASIKSVLLNSVQLFFDDPIEKFTTLPIVRDEEGKKHLDMDLLFKPEILRNQPTVLFVEVPERKSLYMMPVMSVFFSQLFDMTTKLESGCPILFMLDEFANIGVIPTIGAVAATARSRRIGLAIAIQGIEQLENNYGHETAANLLNNLKTKMIYSGLTGDSAEYVSKLSGVTTVETKSYSSGGPSGATISESLFSGAQVQKSGTRRELLTSDEVRTMPADEVLIIAHNKYPVFDAKNTYYSQPKYMEKVNIGKNK